MVEGYSLCLLKEIIESLGKYERNEITVRNLGLEIEGTCNAIMDQKLTSVCQYWITKINDATHLYNEKDGRSFLLEEIADFKEMIEHEC